MINHNLIQMSRFCNDLHDDEKIVFCKTDFILEEFERIRNFKKNIILIIANSDYSVTDDILSRCPPNVKHIFATNTTSNSDKVTPIPIGVEIEELTTRAGHGMINPGIFEKKPYLLGEVNVGDFEVKNKIYSNFNVNTNIPIRSPLKNYCFFNENFSNEEGLTYGDFVKGVKSHMATLSPRGNGIECIRTYEVLYLKSIPIIYGNSEEYNAINNKIYKNLPVVFVGDIKEFDDFRNVEKRIKEVKNNSLETLDYYYWVDKIKKMSEKI